MSVFEGHTITVNPGRCASVATADDEFVVDRERPGRVTVELSNHKVRLNDTQAAAYMRALAAVLGYEIGERYEC